MGRWKERIKRIPVLGPLCRWIMGWVRLPSRVRELAEQRPIPLPPAQAPSRMAVYVGDNTVLTTVRGLKMFLDTRDIAITPLLLLDDNWEYGVSVAFLQAIREGMTFVNVGANMGYYALLGARMVGEKGKVIAFEPEPTNLELLRRSTRINGFSEIIRLSPLAVSDRKGTAELYVAPWPSGAGHTLFADVSPAAVKHLPIETTSLDEFFDPGTRIDLVLVDTEGAESRILRGMQRVIRDNPHMTLILEFCPLLIQRAGEDPKTFLDEIRASGFLVRRIAQAGTVEEASDEYLLHSLMENLFLRMGR